MEHCTTNNYSHFLRFFATYVRLLNLLLEKVFHEHILLHQYRVQRTVETDNNLRRLHFKTLLMNYIKNNL